MTQESRSTAELFDGLTTVQASAATLLGEGVRPRDIRAKLDIPRTTWWRWQQSEVFQAAVSKVQVWLLKDARARQMQLLEAALDVLEKAMDSAHWTTAPESGAQSGIPASAVAAARDILDRNGLTALPAIEDAPPAVMDAGNVYANLGAWSERTVSTADDED